MENNMKQFNLQEYLANPERKVVTRDGHKVRILCTDRKGDTPIIALVHNAKEEQEYGYAFYSDGKFFRDGNDELDLFFAPEKHEGWINLPALTPEEQGDLPHPFQITAFETEAQAREAREEVERCSFKDGNHVHYCSAKIQWEK